MLIIVSRIPYRDISINTNSTPEQFFIPKNKIQEFGGQFKPLNEYKKAIKALDDNLDQSDSNYLDQLFIRGKQNDLDTQFLSQS